MAKNHFVPQFYLKNFSIKGKPEYLYRYWRGKEPAISHVSNVSAIKDYYTVTLVATGEKSDQFEKLFSLYEAETKPVIDKLIQGSDVIHLSKEEIVILARYISFQYHRGPAFRAKLDNVETHYFTQYLSEISKDISSFQKASERMNLNITNESELEFKRQQLLDSLELIKNKVIKFKRERGEAGATIKDMMDLTEQTIPSILFRSWQVFVSKMSGIFVTSDNPVTIMILEKRPHTESEALERGLILLPLSPSRCLALFPGDVGPEVPVVPINHQQLKMINHSTISHAYREVYAHCNLSKIRNALDKTKEGEAFEALKIPLENI